MVVKTETCSFSGFRIYPGHGIFFIRGDSKGFRFINRKSKSLFTQRLNPRKLAWTVRTGANDPPCPARVLARAPSAGGGRGVAAVRQ